MDDVKEFPFSHRILDKDPQSRKAITIYGKILTLVTLLITLTIWGILGIYWGANWKLETGIHKMNGAIVDFDGGIIGATITQAYLNNTGQKSQIDWYTVPAKDFPNGESDLEKAVVDERYWAVIAIHAGTSDRLNAALAASDASNYDNQVAAGYAAEARNENSYRDIVQPQIRDPMTQAMAVFTAAQTARLGTNAGAILTTAPSLILQPLNYTLNNIRPFDIYVATAVDFVGLIYLLILAFIVVLAAYSARVMTTDLNRRLTLPQLLILRFSIPFIIYFWLSLAYCLLSLFFHVPFDRQFGRAGFVVFWMLSWMGMLALGLAIETMVTILTARFIPFFLVPWIITNVSVVYYPVEILPTIFRYGYAMPFYNVSRAVRTILFRTRNDVGMNFGILFAWVGVSIIALSLAQTYERRQHVKAWQADMEKRETMSGETTREEIVEV